MLDLNLLRVFEAMLEHQNVTLAARQVGLSQSALSSALGRLRRNYGDPLFVKTRGGMLPTARALEAGDKVRAALALVRASTAGPAAFDFTATRRPVRFYMTDVGEVVFLPALMKRLTQLGAAVRIETAQLPTDQVARGLATGDVDLAAGYLGSLPKGVLRAPLFREHYVCMSSRNHPIAHEGRLTLKTYLAARHVLIDSLGSGHRAIERLFERRGLALNVALRVPHFMVVPMILADTDLLVTMPSRAAEALASMTPVDIHPLPVRMPAFDVALHWHQRFGEEPAVAWMREQMIGLFQSSSLPVVDRRIDPMNNRRAAGGLTRSNPPG